MGHHMAKLRRKGKKMKYDWFTTKVHLEVDTFDLNSSPNFADSLYVDVAQCLSIANRKLVRQGQIFKISNLQIYSKEADADDFRIKVGTLPKNWVTRNAWVKSKALFDEMNARALMDLSGPNMLPKWHDYKILFNNEHYTQVASSTEGDSHLPRDLDDTLIPGGEWVYSQFSDSGGGGTSDEYNVHMLGDHNGSTGSWTSVGLIKAYAESRNQVIEGPTQITGIEDSPWGKLFGDDDQTHDIVDNLQDNNDSAPYDMDDYCGSIADGGEVVVCTRLQEGNIPMVAPQPRTFFAPCGLLRFEVDADQNEGTIGKTYITFDAEPIAPMDA